MMKFYISITCILSGLVLGGCSALGMDNRSLEYKKAQQLDPLAIPQQTAPVRNPTPMYPAPTVEKNALEHAPRYENERGNRYQLPRPASISEQQQTQSQLKTLRPHFIYDGNKNPLLQVAGESQLIWQYTTATLSSLNYNMTQKTAKSVTIDKDGTPYMIYLSQVGATHVIAVYTLQGTFATPEIANEILTQLYQNWPV